MYPLLRSIGQQVQAALGGDCMAVYVVGSYATGNVIETSDIDMIAVLARAPNQEEQRDFIALRDSLRLSFNVDLDLTYRVWDTLKHSGMGLKREGHLVCGEDIRPQIREATPDEIRSHAVAAALQFVQRLRPGVELHCESLGYPDADDEFKGYLDFAHPRRPLAPLFSLSFIATAKIALASGELVTNKHLLPAVYAQTVNDRFNGFVADLLLLGRDQWQYQIPAEPGERLRLSGMCETALGFEREFLKIVS